MSSTKTVQTQMTQGKSSHLNEKKVFCRGQRFRDDMVPIINGTIQGAIAVAVTSF